MPNRLRFAISSSLEPQVKERIAGAGAILTTSIKGAGGASGPVIDYMTSLDGVLGTPGYQFAVDDLLIFDQNSDKLEVSFSVDLRTAYLKNTSSHSFLALRNSTTSFQMLPGLPALSHPHNMTYVSILQSQNFTNITYTYKFNSDDRYNLALNLTFDSRIPTERIQIMSVHLSSRSGVLQRSTSLQVDNPAPSSSDTSGSILQCTFTDIGHASGGPHETYEIIIVFEYRLLNNFSNEKDKAPNKHEVKYKVPGAVVHAIAPMTFSGVDYLPKSGWMKPYEQNADDDSFFVVDVAITLADHLKASMDGVHAARGLQLLLRSSQGLKTYSDCFAADHLYAKVVCLGV